MFYLMTHSTHFILRLYGVGHMVKDHSDSERKPTATTWVTLSNEQQGFFYMHHPTDRIAHTMAFVTPVVEHWLEREIAQWVHPMKDRSDDPSHHERTLLPRSYISLQSANKPDVLNHEQQMLFYINFSTDMTVFNIPVVEHKLWWGQKHSESINNSKGST